MTVTFNKSGTGESFGGNVIAFRDSEGVGNSTSANGSGDPSLNFTTSLSDSAVVTVIGDWASVAGANTWKTAAGTATEQTGKAGDGSTYAARVAYHANAGAAGTYNLGTTLPDAQTYNIHAVEIKGTGGIPAAWTRVGTFMVGNNATAGTTYAPTTSAILEVGNVGICVLAKDETGTGTTDGNNAQFTSMTDGVGNTWTEIYEWCNMLTATAADGACVALYAVRPTTQLASGAAVTITYSASTTRKAVTCDEWTIAPGYVLTVTAGTAPLSNDNADPGALAVVTGVNRDHLFIRGTACESQVTTYTADTDYVAFGGSTTTSTSNSGTEATSMGARGESRLATESTSATSDPTVSASDCASIMIGADMTAAAGGVGWWGSQW